MPTGVELSFPSRRSAALALRFAAVQGVDRDAGVRASVGEPAGHSEADPRADGRGPRDAFDWGGRIAASQQICRGTRV